MKPLSGPGKVMADEFGMRRDGIFNNCMQHGWKSDIAGHAACKRHGHAALMNSWKVTPSPHPGLDNATQFESELIANHDLFRRKRRPLRRICLMELSISGSTYRRWDAFDSVTLDCPSSMLQMCSSVVPNDQITAPPMLMPFVDISTTRSIVVYLS